MGTAIGAVSAGVAGAAAGAAMGGPIGAVVGAAAGATVGAVAGNSFVSEFDVDEEEAFWSDQYQFRPYYRSGTTFADYEPAYRYGWESARRPEFKRRSFEDLEDELAAEWRRERNAVTDDWRLYRDAVRDAWSRIRKG
jgi:hypothetical protein